MKTRLFVYGTLAPGRTNHHLLQHIPGKWEPASISGRLTQGSRGSARGYPGVILDHSGNKVTGYLFTSYRLDSEWRRLDEFEGDGYIRKTATVCRGNGSLVKAQVYALKGSVSRLGGFIPLLSYRRG